MIQAVSLICQCYVEFLKWKHLQNCVGERRNYLKRTFQVFFIPRLANCQQDHMFNQFHILNKMRKILINEACYGFLLLL